MMGNVRWVEYGLNDRVDDLLLLEAQVIELVFVVAHWPLEAAWTCRFVDLQQFLILIHLKERAHVVRLGDKQTGVMDAAVYEIFIFENWRLHEGRKLRVLGLVQQIDGFVEIAGRRERGLVLLDQCF